MPPVTGHVAQDNEELIMPLLMSILGHYVGFALLWAMLVHVAIAVPTGLQLARIAGMKWYLSVLLTVLIPGLGTLAMIVIALIPSARRQAEELTVQPPGEAFADRARQARATAKQGIALVAPFVALIGAICGFFLVWVSAGDAEEGLRAADLQLVNVLAVTAFGILVALACALFFSADWSNVIALGMVGTMANIAIQLHFFIVSWHAAPEAARAAVAQDVPAEVQSSLEGFPAGEQVGPGPAWWVFLSAAVVAYCACWVYVLLFARPAAAAAAAPGAADGRPGSGAEERQPAMAGAGQQPSGQQFGAPQFGAPQGQQAGPAPQFGGGPQFGPGPQFGSAPQFGPGSQFGSGPQFGPGSQGGRGGQGGYGNQGGQGPYAR